MPKNGKGKEAMQEKKFVIGLQRLYSFPSKKRSAKAISMLKKFVFKHTRVASKNVLLSNKLNAALWRHGREHIPRKLAIKVIEAEGKANVFLQSEKVKVPKEGKKEERKEERKTPQEIAAEEEKELRKEEKKVVEKAAEATAIKRGTA